MYDRQKLGHYELADLKSRDYYYDGFINGYTQCQEDMVELLDLLLKHQELTQWIEEEISDEINNVVEPSHDFINILFEKVYKLNH